MKNIKTLPCNPLLDGMADMTQDIVYAVEDGRELTLRIIKPWKNDLNKARTYPLVVFIQGSGWTYPNIYYNLPHLCQIAMRGFVVATVTHRSSAEGFPAPAFLVDVKSAIRYLRAHAAEHQIDPGRVAAYGTSSGGNTSLLLALTGDDPRYVSAVHPEQSDAVRAAVDCFGPTDVMALFLGRDGIAADGAVSLPEHVAARLNRVLGAAWNTPEGAAAASAMSPLHILREGMTLPPMLLLYGDADAAVPYEQGENMYSRLEELGYDAQLIRVIGAEHEGNFWSAAVAEEIIAFLTEKLG